MLIDLDLSVYYAHLIFSLHMQAVDNVNSIIAPALIGKVG